MQQPVVPAMQPGHQPVATIGVLPLFAVPTPTTLVIREKVLSLSGDDFAVKDSNGVVVCKVDGKSLSLHDSKDFLDAQGKHLFTLKKKLISLRGSHEAVGPDGKLLFEVKGKFGMLSSRMVAVFTNASDGKEIEIEVIGNWIDKNAEMTVVGTKQVVGSIRRSFFNARELFGGQQTYQVQVPPHVDLVLIAALCAVFDERNNESK